MSEREVCRLCAILTDYKNSENLFKRNRRKLLQQVEELTGLQLKNTIDLPQYICKTCEEQTLQAHAFRGRCIQAQRHFATIEYKSEQCKVPLIEEVVVPEMRPIKKEKEELKEEGATSPTNTTSPSDADGNSNSDSFNPLAADSADEDIDDMILATKPETSLFKAELDENPEKHKALLGTRRKKLKTRETSPPKETVRRKKRYSGDKSEKKDFICDQCGVRYPSGSNSAFFMHKLRHAEKRYKCEICPKMYFTKAILNRHLAKHSVKSGEEPFPCKFCDRRFMNYSSKVRHERNHTNERPFACNECDKTFTQKQYLENHILTHTGERAFFCKCCNMSFKRKTHLVTHYRSLMHKQNEEKQHKLHN